MLTKKEEEEIREALESWKRVKWVTKMASTWVPILGSGTIFAWNFIQALDK